MSIVTIYTVKTANQIEFGQPATHKLDTPVCSSVWYDSADYTLPAGYIAAESASGTTEIYDASGRHCPLTDGGYFGHRLGTPHIVDIHAAAHFIPLKKVED